MKHENPIIIEFPFGIITYVLYVLPKNVTDIQNTNRNLGWQITFDTFITLPESRRRVALTLLIRADLLSRQLA
jgi:hypothetical protein